MTPIAPRPYGPDDRLQKITTRLPTVVAGEGLPSSEPDTWARQGGGTAVVIDFLAELRPEWQEDAACLRPHTYTAPDGTDRPVTWFPTGGTRCADGRAAMAICLACPVRVACLEYALKVEHGQGYASRGGIWGGRGPRERESIEERRRRTPGTEQVPRAA